MPCLPASSAQVLMTEWPCCPRCFSMQSYSCMRGSLKRAHLQHGNGSGHRPHATSAHLQRRHAGAARLPHCCAHAIGISGSYALYYHRQEQCSGRHSPVCESAAALRKRAHRITLAILRLELPGVEAGAHMNGYKHEASCCARRWQQRMSARSLMCAALIPLTKH